MKRLNIQLPIGDDGALEEVTTFASCEPAEEVLLGRFVSLMARVRETPWLQRGMSGFQGLNIDSSGLSIKADQCSDVELHALLHVLRPVTLERENSNFQRAAAILGRRIEDPRVRSFLKTCNRVFREGEMSLYMQITIGEQKLFDESLLDIWLNGKEYHSDVEKAAAWDSLEKSLTAANGRAVVVAQLHSKVAALLNIDYLAREVLAANDA